MGRHTRTFFLLSFRCCVHACIQHFLVLRSVFVCYNDQFFVNKFCLSLNVVFVSILFEGFLWFFGKRIEFSRYKLVIIIN